MSYEILIPIALAFLLIVCPVSVACIGSFVLCRKKVARTKQLNKVLSMIISCNDRPEAP